MLSRKGNIVANQFIIKNDRGTYFQSYKSIIAYIPHSGMTCTDKTCDMVNCIANKIQLDEYYWNYSRTTSKYLSLFLGESTAEIRKHIKDGTYTLANLN